MFYDMLTTQCNTNRKNNNNKCVSIPSLGRNSTDHYQNHLQNMGRQTALPQPREKNSVPSVSARRRDSHDDDDLEMELVRENYGKCSDSKALQALGYEGMGEMPREIGSSSWFTYQSNCWRQELPQQQQQR